MKQPSDLIVSLVDNLDLDDFTNIQTGVLRLLHPITHEPTASTIELASPEHPARKKIDMARTRRLRAAFNQTGKMPVSDPTEDLDEETDLLVTATLGWNLTQGGKPLEFSADAARKLFTDAQKQWVRWQVRTALDKTTLFINSSAKP